MVTYQGALAYVTKMQKPLSTLPSRSHSSSTFLRPSKSYYLPQSQSVNFGVDTPIHRRLSGSCSPPSEKRSYKARSGKKRDFRVSIRKLAEPKSVRRSSQQEEKTCQKTEEKVYNKPFRTSSAATLPRKLRYTPSNPTPQVIDPGEETTE